MAGRVEEPITIFTGPYRWLSNFWPAPLVYEDQFYPTVEHAYVAVRTLNRDVRKTIAELDTPGKAKRFGCDIILRHDWEMVKLTVMEDLLERKFAITQLRLLLQSTAPRRLIEGNTWGDTFWGVCNGVGDNHLGELLMKIRDNFPMTDEGIKA